MEEGRHTLRRDRDSLSQRERVNLPCHLRRGVRIRHRSQSIHL